MCKSRLLSFARRCIAFSRVRLRRVYARSSPIGRSVRLGVCCGLWATRMVRLKWGRLLLYSVICTTVVAAAFISTGIHYIYFDRTALPDIEPLARFELPAISTIYDVNGRALLELAKERRKILQYDEIPVIVRHAIIAAEDKRFFSHSGIDYAAIPRALGKIRLRALVSRLFGSGSKSEMRRQALLPQGGSTITQQLVRGHFLKDLTARENSHQLLYAGISPLALSTLIGARTVNMLVRKIEEMRLSLWVEEELQNRFGSKRNAKEEILARYASLIYMGHGQYGFAVAAEYYFGRALTTFTIDDADKAALLAGIAKAPRYYAPSTLPLERVLRRRNQTLTLMAANGFISLEAVKFAEQGPIETIERGKDKSPQAPAVLGTILQELKGWGADLTPESLFLGRIQVYSTVDARVQQIANDALERGLQRYEQRHPAAKGLIQGSVVVLRNRDASILAETGGRQFYQGRAVAQGDYNRVTKSLRQPGSTMKPMVYLAAFRNGDFNLDSMVLDLPIGVANGENQATKWISNDSGQFRGMIPLRTALAESSNAAAVWLAGQVGMDRVLDLSRTLGVKTRLQPYASTALGASEVNLLELANAYRTMATGIIAQPHVIRKIVGDSVERRGDYEMDRSVVDINHHALALIQEGLRGVVRIPTGTAHSLDSIAFPIAVMGKTGTTSDYRDALFVGSTFGLEGITVAVRFGFDDNRSLGEAETGGRVALPVFRDLMLRVYRSGLVGPAPAFPEQIEQNISDYLARASVAPEAAIN